MDIRRPFCLLALMIIAMGCQSSPPAQPPPEPEDVQAQQDESQSQAEPSSSFDGLEEDQKPVVPTESTEERESTP